MATTGKKQERVIIRFAGDSGDGMQLVGGRFTARPRRSATTCDPSGLPGRDPRAGRDAAGVSGFQIHFASTRHAHAGRPPDMLVAMNPAALKTQPRRPQPGGMLIVNKGAFTEANLRKAGLREGSARGRDARRLPRFTPIDIAVTSTCARGQRAVSRARSAADEEHVRARVDVVDVQPTARGRRSSASSQVRQEARDRGGEREGAATRAGTSARRPSCSRRTWSSRRRCRRDVSQHHGQQATALGLIAPACELRAAAFFGTYPITPACERAARASKPRHFNVITFQAEDEIAAVCTALGASFAGNLGHHGHVRTGDRV